MNEMNIHSTAPKPNTSRPGKQHKIYPYLLKNLKIERANQVWATDVPGIRDVIVHNQTGLLVPPKAEALQKAIKLLKANTILCKSLGRRARKQIIKNNSFDEYMNKEINLYKHMVKYGGFSSI